ncbi:DUF1501 domain-containing protein [bacterium]|nr:DUF1501 domain-containing protein [bacterium]MDA7680539.1 DUF1501 domain-containing protein [bacterium]MDA7866534.1 DUF1501 domain-containing protein [Verrucomicrobiota bacterium]
MLRQMSTGFGALAASTLLGKSVPSVGPRSHSLPPHKATRCKHVIFLFMEGGISQVDSYDHKPALAKFNGQDPRKAIGRLEKTQFANIGKVQQSPWEFQRHGQAGLWASDLFPHVAKQLDHLCLIKSMTSKFPEHTSANYFLHSGVGLQGRPSAGAWVSYGLGSENENLPGYIVLNGGQVPSGGLDNFSNGFLPAVYQGSLLNAIGKPVANISALEATRALQEKKRELLRELNLEGLRQTGPHDALESAIYNSELAAKMQVAVPDLMDLKGESEATRKLYGFDSDYEHTRTYARECLLARRLVERGVRFVELTIPMVAGYSRWDAHGGLKKNHGDNARAVDQPIAGLIQDLRQRGLWDETLLVWGSEFGRTPFAQGSNGRDHNEYGFTMWLGGGGIQGGMSYGETDEFGYKAVVNPLEMHDLHATILHSLGIDHERLTYRFSGRDIRLTDVSGRVVRDILRT